MLLARTVRQLTPLALAGSVAGCGLVTPSMQSPLQPLATDALVSSIVGHAKSEVGCAVIALINKDNVYAKENKHPPNLAFLDNSIVIMTLNLTVVENSSLAAGLSDTKIFPNSVATFAKGGSVTSGQSFTLGLGATASSAATRKISVDYTFSVRNDFMDHSAQYTDCKPYDGALIGGDLKIADSFNGALAPLLNNNPAKGTFVGPGQPNTLETEITFVIATSGSIGPVWKLVPISINPGSPLGNFSQTSTDDVIITIGPKAAATQTAHNIAKAGALLDQAVTSGM